jgi:pimeloyl-ACP methyl ester carboxylesterase
MARPRTRSVNAPDGTPLAYQVLGDGPVDLVWSSSSLSDVELVWGFPPLASFLRSLASFSRLIMLDRRGMGRSGGGLSPNIGSDLDDLLVVLDAVGAERPCLGGPLIGGAISAIFAASHPDRAAALVWYGAFARSARAPDYPWGATEEEQVDMEQGILDAWATEARAARFLEANAPSIAEDRGAVRFFARWMQASTSAADAVRLERLWYEMDLRPYLASLTAPALILHRQDVEHDEDVHTASLIRGAEIAAVPGADFIPFVGEIAPIVSEIRRFALGAAAGSRSATPPGTVGSDASG